MWLVAHELDAERNVVGEADLGDAEQRRELQHLGAVFNLSTRMRRRRRFRRRFIASEEQRLEDRRTDGES